MLSPEERKRLKERDSENMDSQIKASNDIRARRKLAKWLKEDLDDVFLIIDKLPVDQLKKVFSDDNVDALLLVASAIMCIEDFAPIEGELEYPEKWRVPLGENKSRPATILDMIRSIILTDAVTKLNSRLGNNNPVINVMRLKKLYEDPYLRDRITDKERKAINVVRQAQLDFVTTPDLVRKITMEEQIERQRMQKEARAKEEPPK